jgi:hypothetical protein
MSNKPKIVEVDESTIPEVQQHLTAREKLESLRAAYPGVFEEFEEIVNEYNATLEAADKAVRAKQVTCGPFQIINFRTTYNADVLYASVDREEFLRLGGAEQTIKQYSLDEKVFDSFVAQQKVPANVVAEVIKTAPSYKSHKKIILP